MKAVNAITVRELKDKVAQACFTKHCKLTLLEDVLEVLEFCETFIRESGDAAALLDNGIKINALYSKMNSLVSDVTHSWNGLHATKQKLDLCAAENAKLRAKLNRLKGTRKPRA